MPRKPQLKYGKYGFYVEKPQNAKGVTKTRIIRFAGQDERGFLFSDITKRFFKTIRINKK